MKTFCLLPLILGVAGLAHADTIVGSGHVISETRAVSGFHGVGLNGSGKVVLTQGDTEGVVIEAEDNLLPLIESRVGNDGILHLGFKPHEGSIESKREVVYKVSAKVVDQLAVHGSGSIRAATVAADKLWLHVPGSGEIGVDRVQAAAVKVNVEGSGAVTLAGTAPRLAVTIDGSGNCQAKGLQADDTAVAINGSGEARVSARKTLEAEINGSGEVTYSGDPKVTKQINGSGEVEHSGPQED